MSRSPRSVAKKKSPAEGAAAGRRARRGARGRDRRRVLEDRRHHALVDSPVVDDRPAVVLSGLDDVDLVAAARAVESRRSVLRLDQEARLRVPVEALRVAVAVGEDRRAGKRIVRGDRAVGIQAQRLAAERGEVLRDFAVRRVAGRDVELRRRDRIGGGSRRGTARPGSPRSGPSRSRERVAVVAEPRDADGGTSRRVVGVAEDRARASARSRARARCPSGRSPPSPRRRGARRAASRGARPSRRRGRARAARSRAGAPGRRERHRPRHLETRHERRDHAAPPRSASARAAGAGRREGRFGRRRRERRPRNAAAARGGALHRRWSGRRGRHASHARRRWDTRSFSSGAISANVRSPPSGTKIDVPAESASSRAAPPRSRRAPRRAR